jgi:adenylate kinase family enzyme
MVQERLETYRRKTEPMLRQLAAEGRLIIIKGSGEKEAILQRAVEKISPGIGGSTERK